MSGSEGSPQLLWDILLEVSLGSVGHNQAASLLLDSAGQRELDLGVVHLLDQGTAGLVSGHSLTPDDLDGVSPGPVPGAHVPVALGDSASHGQVPVLPVHVVGAGPGVVSQPDAEVLDLHRLPLLDLLHADDLAGGLLELPQLSQEVPEPGLG